MFCPVLKSREEKQTFAKIVEGNVDFLLFLPHGPHLTQTCTHLIRIRDWAYHLISLTQNLPIIAQHIFISRTH
jgi:hypothetical protein